MNPHSRSRTLFIVILALILLVIASIRHFPVYLPHIDSAVEMPEPGEHRVFGYATLRNPVVRLVVTGHHSSSSPAALTGFVRVGRDLEPQPSGLVEGDVFEVDAAGLRRLDRYERLGDRYMRQSMALTDGSHAWVYFMYPDCDTASECSWRAD